MSRRSSRAADDGEFVFECKAAYLSIYDDIKDDIQSKDELLSVLQQSGRNPLPRRVTIYWPESADYLTFDDFVDICRKEPTTSKDDLIKAFRKIDTNNDGYLSLEELYKIMTSKGERISRDEVKKMIDEVDENQDGRLDYGEFCNMVMSTTEESKKLQMKMLERKERKKRQADEQKMGSRASMRSAGTVGSHHSHPKMGSRASVKSDDTLTEEHNDVAGSQASLRSGSQMGSRKSLLSIDDFPKPSPRGRKEKPRAAAASKLSRLSEPKRIKEWTHSKSKGCFFIEEDKLISHQYELSLTEDSNVWITIQPVSVGSSVKVGDNPVDTALYVLTDDDEFVAFTEQRDVTGKYGVQCNLSAGKYYLLPFTTGCRLKPRDEEPKEAKLVRKDKDDKVAISKGFKRVLTDMFEMCDLDGNGLMSRDEFNWFNLRTSGEEVADDEWSVVEEKIELENGEITQKGFIQLNEMEAEDGDGDLDDLWVTVTGMGFNKALIMDEACPFRVDVYTEVCDDAELSVMSVDPIDEKLESAVAQSIIEKGESTKIQSMRDLFLHTYTSDARSSIAIENKSNTDLRIRLDCSKSRHCVSNKESLTCSVEVPSHSNVVGFHFLPESDSSEWLVRCNESIQK